MFRPLLISLAVVVSACGPLGPPKSDGGVGGGTGLFFGGGTGGSGGGSGGSGGSGGGVTGGGTTGGGTGGATGGGVGAAPNVTTAMGTGVATTTAMLNGSANPNGSMTTGWFRYAAVNPGTCDDTFGTRAPASGGTNLGASNAAMPFAQALSGLLPGVTYYFCAIAQNPVGAVFGLVLSFTTPGPVVVTNPATVVTATSATLNGRATPSGAATTGWFRYGTNDPGTCNDSFGTRVPATGGTVLGSGSSPVPYLENVTGLLPGTTYFHCALAQNSVATSFGAVLSFTTPLSWASMSISGATSTSYIIGLSGAANDVWAAQDTGYVFHSTGGAFSLQFPIQYGIKALYAAGGTVVIVQTRSIRTCTSNCTTATAFADFQLLNGTYNLFGEAVCGRGPNDITVIVTDTQNAGQVFHWNGTAWTRTDTNLGVSYPRSCWFDATGALYVVGQDAVVKSDMGANSVDTLSTNFMTYYGGADVAGTPWVVGASHYIARRTAPATWTRFPVTTSSTLWTVGGLSANEVYAFGYWETSVGNGFKWNGTALTPVGNLLPNTGTQSTIRTMLVTAANELYVAGSNQSGPIIIRGRR